MERMLARVAPGIALKRAVHRQALSALKTMHYDAATTGRRGASWNASRGDADSVASYGRRARMAAVARDMIRNTPFAVSGQRVIASNVVGDGIIPKFVTQSAVLKEGARDVIERHLDTTDIDIAGRSNLYGLQRLAMNAVVDAGEVLIVAHFQPRAADLHLPLQLEVLEVDYLDSLRDGLQKDGSYVQDGIAYGPDGRRTGYWMYTEHPGASGHRGGFTFNQSVFVPASRVAHVFRVDRPGQNRGVSWFAPVALSLQDLGDYQDAQLMRQKIAACFAGFRKLTEQPGENAPAFNPSLSPGLMQDIGPDEEITFSDPPTVGDFDPMVKTVLRSVASGLGITYEALAGDLAGVNFSSARMGRVEMDRNVSAWQRTMLIPQMCNPVGRWLQMAWIMRDPGMVRELADAHFKWVPPHKIIVDPAREIPALVDKIRGGLESLEGAQRSLGHDPERLREEQRNDRAWFDQGYIFDSDAKSTSGSGVTQARPAGATLLEGDADE